MKKFIIAVIFFLIASFFLYHKSTAEDAPEKNPATPVTSVEQQRILTKMEQAKAGVNDDQKDLLTREMELKTLNEEVDKKLEEINQKLEELKTIQKSYKDLLAQKDQDELKRVKELGKIYEKMAPDKAAFALANMDEKLATDILGNMKVKSAASILNVLDRKKTAELSTAFSTLK